MESFNTPNTTTDNVALDANGFTPEEQKILAEMDNRKAAQGTIPSGETKGTIADPASGTSEMAQDAPQKPPETKPPDHNWETRYKDLERKFQQTQDQLKKLQTQAPGNPKVASPEPQKENTQASPPESKEAQVPAPDINLLIDGAINEGLAKGKPSEETYVALEKAGRTRTEVDLLVSAASAKSMEIQRDVLSVLGPDLTTAKSDYNTMLSWAREHYTKEDAAEFDRALTSPDTTPTRMKQQVELLRDRYMRVNGTPRTSHVSGSGNSGANSGAGALFSSNSELRIAMQDKRYGRDSAYTMEVEEKAQRSIKAGRI